MISGGTLGRTKRGSTRGGPPGPSVSPSVALPLPAHVAAAASAAGRRDWLRPASCALLSAAAAAAAIFLNQTVLSAHHCHFTHALTAARTHVSPLQSQINTCHAGVVWNEV